jgi:hypothetical protein
VGTLGQRPQVVAALQDQNQPVPGVAPGDGAHAPAQRGEAPGGDAHAAQRIVAVSIEPGRHQQQVGAVGIGNGLQQLVEDRRELGIAASLCERHVDGMARARTGADLVGAARARVERVSVRAEVQHVAAVIERVLRAVAVVDVPVHDEHALVAQGGAGVGRRYGDVVEEAEPHGPPSLGVVARRTHQGEGASRISGGHGRDRIDRCARGQERRGHASRRDRGVQVQGRRSPAQLLDPIHVGRLMDALDRLARRRLRDRPPDPGHGRASQRRDDGPQAVRPLRVIRPRIMAQHGLIDQQQYVPRHERHGRASGAGWCAALAERRIKGDAGLADNTRTFPLAGVPTCS